ncbi:MAG TPA: nucleotidyltransferase domain-containing protein [Candidatus Krumholzibacteriaceae bacterium]|nr:nucleotidyltransferase domain-containing protein [Candidatus Krumholzibacteriaceae bacterium]
MHVDYTEGRWLLLRELRAEAEEMMRPLHEAYIDAVVYGSIARGDVREGSDVDIWIPSPPSPTVVQAVLERRGIRIRRREIIQATPSYAAKAYLYTEPGRGYSLPLVELRASEAEFYRFAGSLSYQRLQTEARVPGVDKRLMLIEPTETGHKESTIQGREGRVAGLLGVDIKIVQERVRTLERRGKVGRTGVYIKRVLADDEDFGAVFEDLVMSKPALRRRMRQKR